MVKKIVKKEENIWNVPNTLTFIRVLITFAIIYLILADFTLISIIILFIIGMITDFLDGQIARRYNQVTDFGRKFDMIADRFLMFGTIIMFLLDYSLSGGLSRWQILQIFLIVSREILTFPIAFAALIARLEIPHARFIGKLTTFMQGVTFPIIMLSSWETTLVGLSFIKVVGQFSLYFSIATCIIGLISAGYYIYDLTDIMKKKKK